MLGPCLAFRTRHAEQGTSQSITTTSAVGMVPMGGTADKTYAISMPIPTRASSTTSSLDKCRQALAFRFQCLSILLWLQCFSECMLLRAARDAKVTGESSAILDILHSLWSEYTRFGAKCSRLHCKAISNNGVFRLHA
jgi:hypothetical protein